MAQEEHRPPATFQAPSLQELAHYLPQYEIHDFIAQGGMGAVYLARQAALDRFVAIKVLPAMISGETDMDFTARFQIEARAMAKLHHGNIVGVFDFGTTQAGHLFLVMEYVPGHTLHDLIHTGVVTKEHALSYALQLCDAIQYAHDHGIIHRDIKPNNILISTDGHVKVADFGLARATAAQDQEVMMGTPDYAAPEITQGIEVDQRADIYAMGVLFYETLTQTLPKKTRQPASAIAGCDPGWDEVIAKATRVFPKDRYQQVKEMRQSISMIANRRRFPSGGGPQRVVSDAPKTWEQPEEPTSLISLLIKLMIVAAIGLTGLYFWNARKDPEEQLKTITAEEAPKVKKPKKNKDQTTTPPEMATATEPVGQKRPMVSVADLPAVNVAEVPAGHLSKFQQSHNDIITGVALLPDQKRAVTSSVDGTVKVWTVAKGECLQTFTAESAALGCIALSNDGKWVAAGGNDSQSRVWNLDSGELKGTATSPGKQILSLNFSPADNALLIASSDQNASLQIWKFNDGFNPYPLDGWTGIVQSVARIPNTADERFITAGRSSNPPPNNTEMRIGSFKSNIPLGVIRPLSIMPFRIAVSPDSRWLAAVQSRAVAILDIKSEKEIARCEGLGSSIFTLRFLVHGRLLLTGCADSTIRIFETITGKEMWKATGETHCTNYLDVSADESFLVTGGGIGSAAGQKMAKDEDYALHLWRLPDLKTLVSSDAALVAARIEMATAPPVDDTELNQLKAQFESQWEERVVKGAATLREDLDNKYVAALRSKLVGIAPSERNPILNEISRVANKGAVPPVVDPGAPPILKQLMKIYLQQGALVGEKLQESTKAWSEEQSAAASALEAARKQRGDTAAAARVKAMWEAWSSSHAAGTANPS